MENISSLIPFSRIEEIRHRLAGHALADDDGAIWIVAASAQNWPELMSLSVGEVMLGDDGLIRLALWSASKCCATLLGTRRATLVLPEGGDMREIRCLVIANASLATPRPLSGFLMKPVELLDGPASRNVRRFRGARRTPEDSQHSANETRLALFDAFPVGDDGRKPPSGEVHTP
ncbi:hypothetical protein [Bradyrhizobium sp. dw_411]|uniref:hypothetical protein n=1 Tax=Bradyrhizobium sp. dw_411 TaxID=2720082 RepID=UPI001BCFAD24|nr:hypothetical protein [Bradyrhizobium sp. dw_411]